MRKRNPTYAILALILLLAMLPLHAACFLLESSEAGGLVINEVVTSNGASLLDSTYGKPDWIELYNGSSRDINLSCYQLTKNPNKPGSASLLPDVVIKAGGYLILYANKSKDVYEPGGPICLGFNLSKGGDMLVLADDRNNIIQELEIPTLERDISYARRADGSYGFCNVPTPGAANTTEIFPTLQEALGREDNVGVGPQTVGECPVVFNEVVAKNRYSLPVDCCDNPDWVELYNTSSQAFFLN
ncbi:MAG: lamin tail domain-containing protein, partial [Clostridiales bacterium]|nr:lamin tail domain-containing protein [Clostridiales bacterium]